MLTSVEKSVASQAIVDLYAATIGTIEACSVRATISVRRRLNDRGKNGDSDEEAGQEQTSAT
jgi:hypothetical protein